MILRRCFHGTTFLSTKRNIKLPKDPTSTVYKGRLFEWQTLQAFEMLGMQLEHIGGKSDGGLDLKGEWCLIDNNIPVVVQCKNVKNGCTPDHLRGLLGATVNLNMERQTLGILVSGSSKTTFTPDTMTLFNQSSLPLGLARVCDTMLQALVLNHAAQQWLDINIHLRFDPLGRLLPPPLILSADGRQVVQSSLLKNSITTS
ncbi:uncharacterized protein BX664DRAFT_338098 [Halteromyces radiatus]|uniref:uncharacterized protein n=1 Tax=Halteromyces radiatus TaxID=101107 RepID=UPI002220078E|nr:uncharacterized protein BX664DRAFT_338098 [Halteromyces radiatus]KAI8084912.1 hypothetical protein BX664DRAFT_338098 [Halteromyces radiatus]